MHLQVNLRAIGELTVVHTIQHLDLMMHLTNNTAMHTHQTSNKQQCTHNKQWNSILIQNITQEINSIF